MGVSLFKPLPLLGALALAVLAAGLRWAIHPLIVGVPLVTFFPAVMLAAYLWGTRFAVVTACVSAVIPPHTSFAIDDVGDGVTLGLLTLILLAIAFVIGGFRELVEISWERAGERLRLQWQESGGPPVSRPQRSGFGTRLIERSLAAELEGSARLDYRPGGLVCTIEARVEA